MSKKNVLIVEDEAIIALELKLRLEQMGFSVLSIVPSADLAIEKIQLENPDVIFMDIVLRGHETGIDVAKTIRKVSKAPIIFLTGNVHLLQKRLVKKFQPCRLLSKPAQDWELVEAIRELEMN